MGTRLTHLLERLRSSFWLIPAVLLILAIGSALVLVRADYAHREALLEFAPWLGDVSPEGTETLLGTVATSVLTLAGVTFSVTIVALTLASSQFGPRLLRNFIRSLANQFTLGILLATHAYCLVVLRSVRVGDFSFVPHLATFGTFFLTLVSLGCFIYFIHHVVTSIQAEQVVAQVYRELCQTIDRFFDEEPCADDGDEDPAESEDSRARWARLEAEVLVKAETTGYLQAVSLDDVVKEASNRDLRCWVRVSPGEFIVPGKTLVAIHGTSDLNDDLRSTLRSKFIIGPQATAEQDFEYCIRQLVEVALRALSPGVNDPFTAINCIDYLGAALTRIARMRGPCHEFKDADGVIRVKIVPKDFPGFLGAACHQIRQVSVDHPDVSIRLLEMLRGVGERCRSATQLNAVLDQAGMVAEVAKRKTLTDHDTAAIEACYDAVLKLRRPST